jgi:hypothetical protein
LAIRKRMEPIGDTDLNSIDVVIAKCALDQIALEYAFCEAPP